LQLNVNLLNINNIIHYLFKLYIPAVVIRGTSFIGEALVVRLLEEDSSPLTTVALFVDTVVVVGKYFLVFLQS